MSAQYRQVLNSQYKGNVKGAAYQQQWWRNGMTWDSHATVRQFKSH